MSVIAPCITVETEDQYKEYAQKLHAFAKRVHVDISDGEFAPVLLVSEDRLWWPEDWIVDIHAMVARPSEHMATLLKLKPHLVTFHAEVQEDLVSLMKQLQQAGIKAGVALQRQTVPATVSGPIQVADHVMLFSGDLGHYGGVASLMQLEKIRLVHNINHTVEIGWDGGATVENAFSLSQGGVDVLNVGATIAKASDPANVYATLVSEINKHGVI